MRFLLILLVARLFLGSSMSLSQSKSDKDLMTSYKNYFELPRQVVYVHLNKHKFIPGEDLYFSAYLLDQKTGLPVKTPTNLYIGLYDHEGMPVKRTLWPAAHGVAFGNLEINSDFVHGTYYLKADTKWMDNFSYDNRFICEIEILEYEPPANSNTNEKFEIRIIAEGGNLISNIVNTIGFHVNNEIGQGMEIEDGQILDSKGRVIIENLRTNPFGFGKCDLLMKGSEQYTFRIRLRDGRILSKPIPKAAAEGLALNVTGNSNKRVISVRTNQNTSRKRSNQELCLVLHRDGMINLIPFSLDSESKSFSVSRENLFKGVNIISLIDQNRVLLAERIIFNTDFSRKPGLKVEIKDFGKKNDTVSVIIQATGMFEEATSLSVSILPEETVAHKGDKTIVGSILFDRYMNYFAHQSATHFRNFDQWDMKDIDTFLLIYGKSNFYWNKLKEESLFIDQDPDNGISIAGKVRNFHSDKIKSIHMYQDRIEGMKMAQFEKDGSFRIPNAKINKGETVHFTMLDHKGKMRKPELEARFEPKITLDSIPSSYLAIQGKEREYVQVESDDLARWFNDKRIQLENINLIAKARKEQPTRNKNLTLGFWNSDVINEEDVQRNPNLSNYLRRLGFRVQIHPINRSLQVFARTFSVVIKDPVIYLNGFRLAEPLRDFPLHLIDEVYYEHAGLMESNGGTIQIYLREGSIVGRDSNSNFTDISADAGYEAPKSFTSIIDSEDIDDRFRKYSSLFWTPKASKRNEGGWQISFPNKGILKIQVFVEGMSQDGRLFSETFQLELPEK